VAVVGRAEIGAFLLTEGAKPEVMDVHGWNARQASNTILLVIRESSLPPFQHFFG
jgi:hypothetical protein